MKIISYDNVQINNAVVALGKFEGLHEGHMLLIRKVTELASDNDMAGVVLTVDVPCDKAINVAKERYDILEGSGVDYVVECKFSPGFAALLPDEFVKNILVDKLDAKYVIIGKDFRYGNKRSGDYESMIESGKKYGFDVIVFDKLMIEGNIVSSSLIRKLILEGDVCNVVKYMGRHYSVTGTVTHGKMLGRTIGFPTINIFPDKNKLLPKYGVYATYVIIDGIRYNSITNIGTNPTVSDGEEVIVETHIIEYAGDLYDQTVEVYFVKRIRDEKKFDSIDELKRQLNSDRQKAMHQ